MAKAKDFFSKAGGFVSSLVSGAGGLGGAESRDQGKVAATLLKKSPLEVTSPLENVKQDPLAMSTIQYPSDLTSQELGHYIIFYTVTNNRGGVANDFKLAKDVGFQATTGGPPGRGAGTIEDLRKGRGTPPVSLTNTVTSSIPEGQQTTSAISIYMPPGIKASYKNTYDVEEAQLAGDLLQTGRNVASATSRTEALSDIVDGVSGGAITSVKQALSGALDTLGGGDIFRLVSKNVGLAVNPREEQFYVGPGFRSFSYTFDFWPRNVTETETVKNIIKLFKYHSHPHLDKSLYNGRMFVVPSEFEIHYMFNEGKNPHLYNISRCVCTSVDVQYGPENQMSSFDDGAPVTYKLTLEFTEQEFMTKNTIYEGGM